MIVIGGSSHTELAKQIAASAGASYSQAQVKRFADQELKVQINDELRGANVYLVQSTTQPANDHLMELLLLADTAKRAGSQHITAVIPYFGYGRQDRPSYNYGPISASLVARLIETSGVDRVITLDLHSRQSEGFFKNGITNIDPSELFAKEFFDLEDNIVISPDIGGVPRARSFAQHIGSDLAIINKSRNTTGHCVMNEVIGSVEGRNCIIVDDIIDSGSTLFSASDILMEHGAKSVSACITHAVLSEQCVDRLNRQRFTRIVVSNSIHHNELPHQVELLSIHELIAKNLV